MKFTNKINKESLKNALIHWVLGTDGNDGAIDYVMDEIYWSEEMGYDYWEDNVHDRIRDAIGSRYYNGKSWNVSKLTDFSNFSNETMGYRHRFCIFIDKKIEDICSTYQKCIDELNEYIEKNRLLKMDKQYWVATYTEITDNREKSFGCIGGFIYNTMNEAVNAIKNDIEEYKIGLKGAVRVEEDYECMVFELFVNGKLICVWQPQLMRVAE